MSGTRQLQWNSGRPVEFDTRLRSCLGSTNSTAGPFQSSPIISTEPLGQLERRRISRSITQTSADPLSPLRRTRDAWPISNGTGFRAQPEARRSPQVRRATPSGHCRIEHSRDRALFMRPDWRRLDRCARRSGHPRTVPRRRELVGLRARTQGLTRWLLRPLPARRKAVCPTDTCSWRAICPPAAHIGPFSAVDPERWRLEPLF